MGLPQELVDYIMGMLEDDLRTLKACSLTCKAMFASTRRLVHQTLCLSQRNRQRTLITKKGTHHREQDHYGAELCFLSYMGEHGFLKYTRKIHLCVPERFTPDILFPHLHHFQSLDMVHTLTIENYDSFLWASHYKSCFVHFYPALTSLTLRRPFGHYRLVLQFALQFPNLEDLTIESFKYERVPEGLILPRVIDQFPPLRHLRLLSVDDTVQWSMSFTHPVHRSRMCFQSVEFESNFFGASIQRMLVAGARTIEDLTFVPRGNGTLRLPFLLAVVTDVLTNPPPTVHFRLSHLTFTEFAVLRRLTVHVAFAQVSGLAFGLRSILTVTSCAFSEFVLELSRVPSQFNGPSSEYWDRWEEIDRFLEEKFASRGGFKLIIRTCEPHDRKTLQRHARETFPWLERRGCIHFETSLRLRNVEVGHLLRSRS